MARKVGVKNTKPTRAETRTEKTARKRKEIMKQGLQRRKNNKKGRY